MLKMYLNVLSSALDREPDRRLLAERSDGSNKG